MVVLKILRPVGNSQSTSKPRMADFATWVVACEPAAGWTDGAFLKAYDTNRDDATKTVLEADPIASAVITFMENRTEWDGTATKLLEDLSASVGERTVKTKGWPSTGHHLSGKLKRAATGLRRVGIDVEISRSGRSRAVKITQTKKVGDLASQASQASSSVENQQLSDDDTCDDTDRGDRPGPSLPRDEGSPRSPDRVQVDL